MGDLEAWRGAGGGQVAKVDRVERCFCEDSQSIPLHAPYMISLPGSGYWPLLTIEGPQGQLWLCGFCLRWVDPVQGVYKHQQRKCTCAPASL